MNNLTSFELLQHARKIHKQQDLANMMGVSTRQLRRWESDECSLQPAYAAQLREILEKGDKVIGDEDFTFIDLFAGIGGIRQAFERVGGKCVFTSEWDKYAQQTYDANWPQDSHFINGDVTKIETTDIPDHDVLLAGFPCQPFSIAGVSKKNALGRAHGFACETQGTLFFDICRIIDEKQPKAFLLENVKNLKSHDKGRTYDVILRSLQDLGYQVNAQVIDGAHFVPQHRERILIAGFREPNSFDMGMLPLPEKGTHKMREILHRTDGSEPLLDWDIDPKGEHKYFDHDNCKVPDKYTLSDKLWGYLQGYAEKHRAKGNGFGFGLVYPDSVSRTLSARYYKDGSEILVYQGENKNPRRLTPRECARLMGFPDSFRIPVSNTRAYKQFGNSVVVDVIHHVATMMRPHITSTESAFGLPFQYSSVG